MAGFAKYKHRNDQNHSKNNRISIILNIMKKILSIIGCLTSLMGLGQTYTLSFTGSGTSKTVDSVFVENMSQCTSLSMGGNQALNLSPNFTGIAPTLNAISENISAFPNPINNSCTVNLETKVSGEYRIKIIGLTGKEILTSKFNLYEGNNSFTLNGLSEGVYFIVASSNETNSILKVVSIGTSVEQPSISLISNTPSTNTNIGSALPNNIEQAMKKNITTSTNNVGVNMPYNIGDTLKLIGLAGKDRTVSIIIPNQSQAVNFTFIQCADADSNHYAVVQIGSQFWMAENLKTTKYNNGNSLPNLGDSTLWVNSKTGAYCDFNNIPSTGTTGHLYNFEALADNRSITPQGWHVPSDSEWTVLQNFVGGVKIAGRMLKEHCNSGFEFYSSDSTGTNAYGLSILCGNYRSGGGSWSLNNSHDTGFWTSTPLNNNINSGFAWARMFRYYTCDVFIPTATFSSGYSIRCVLNNPPK